MQNELGYLGNVAMTHCESSWGVVILVSSLPLSDVHGISVVNYI
jgi:hypothetical protein